MAFVGLALVGLACAASAGTLGTTPPAAGPEDQVTDPEPPTSPEPTPMTAISAAAMEPVEPEPAPAIELPFDEAQLERILAVQTIVATAAADHEVDPALINGVIWVESKFEPRARGPAGAQGLMQLMPKTAAGLAKRLGRKRASYDPDFNIHAGALLLSRLLARFDGDESLALAAYNRGIGIVAGWQNAGEPLPERTQAFVDRVFEARTWFEAPLPNSISAP